MTKREYPNATSANTASHEISAAMTALEIADANEEHAHNGVVVGIEEAFVTAILPAGVAYDDAEADADAAQAIAFASALSSATGRWVSTAPAGSPVPAYFTAVQAATVTRTTAVANASKNLQKAIHSAESTWVTTVLPARVPQTCLGWVVRTQDAPDTQVVGGPDAALGVWMRSTRGSGGMVSSIRESRVELHYPESRYATPSPHGERCSVIEMQVCEWG